KNDAPFDICDDPDIKQKILDMKDAQESQKRRSSGSVRRINRPNNRSASLRRSSMRGEKSALFMKEAKEEAAHFGVIDLKSSHHITEEDDDEDEEEEEEEEEEVSVTCVDDVELIMGDTKENNTPNLPSVTSQTSYYNGDATAPAKDRNRGLKSSDSSHSRIADAVLLTQKYKAQAITAPPTESSKSNNNNNYNNNSNYSSSSSISSSSKLSARSPSNSRAAAALGMANSRGISSSSSTSNSRTASPRTNTRTASPAANARTSVSAVNNTPRGIPSIQSSSSPDLRPTSIATTTTTTATATTIINTSPTTTTAGAGLTRQSRVADSRRSFEASKSSQKSPPLETNLGYPTKRIGSTSPDVSALANKFNSLSSNANTMKPLETTLGRPVSNSGLNSNRSSKTSVKENRKPSGDISQTRNNNNYNTAVSQTIEAPANNMGRAGGRPAKGSTEQPRNHKLVNGSDSYDRSLNGSTKKTTSVITLTPSDTPAHSNKTPAPLSASQSAVKAPVPPGHSTAPKSSDISTLSSRLKDNSRGDRSSFKDSKAGVNMAPTTITTTTTTTSSTTTAAAAAANPASGKASSDAKTSSTSRPVDVRGPRRNTDNTAPSSDAKANQVSQLERDAKRESTKKGSDSAPKKPEVRGSTNIPYESESGSKPVRTLDEDYATTTTTTTTTFNTTTITTNTNSSSGGTIKGMPQLEPRYPSNRSTGCTLSDLKRQRQANYNRRGSGGSEKLVPPAADNPRAVLPVSSTTVPKLQPNWHNNPSPALSSKIPGHAGANAPNAALTNGNKDSVSKYSAPSTVQVVGDDDRKCCCAIM
ncbi:protein phosphatase 1 regulatory subunit 12A-like isoform X1, partial [Argonauta hians]